jgi:glycosyltransferase involved in cell wall biosynthesis
MRTPKLSICISTYNRGDYLAQTLESIVCQTSEEVEIVLLDGASKDNTPDIGKTFEKRCPQLRYVRIEEDLGFDEKYAKIGELARGEYCWMFTDDDLLKPGAIAAVLEELGKNYSLIVVNAEVCNIDFSVTLQKQRISQNRNRIYRITEDDWNQLFADTGMYLTFIGGLVVKRTLWNAREKVAYFKTMFVHMGALFQAPLPGESLLIAYPWITIRYGNAQWTPRSFEIWMFLFPKLVWNFNTFADWSKNKVECLEPWRKPSRLLIARAMNHYSLNEYQRWLKPLLGKSFYTLIAWTIAVFPVTPLNFFARTLLKLCGKHPSMTSYDLERSRKLTR